MRILVFTNMYPSEDDPSYGTFVHDQVDALRARGVDVDVLFVNGRSSKCNYLKGLFQMRRALAQSSFDIIHAHYVFSGWIARMQRRLPVVVSFHGEPISYHATLSRLLAPRVDACIVTSEAHKKRMGFDDAWVIPCGVDLELFSPVPQAEARAKLGWAQDRKVMVFIGANRPEKRLDIIRGAYEILRSRRDDLDFAFPHGLPHEAIPDYMNAADVLVLASDYEGSPMVIKEAMACNLPLVSTPVGDVPEVTEGTMGCYLCEQNAEDLAAKVEMALEFGKRTTGRDRMTNLQSGREAELVMEVYKTVLAKRSG